MSFFEENLAEKGEIASQKKSASIANKLCQELAKILKTKKASSWDKDMKKTIEDFGEEPVINVMNWLSKAYSKSYQRKLFSAGGFRAYFTDLQKAMENDPTQIEYTELTLKIAKWAQKNFAWPCGTDRELPLVIQRSHDNYVVFRKKWKDLQEYLSVKILVKDKDQNKWDRRFRLHRHITTNLSDPRSFTEFWIEFVGDRLQDWEGWNGSLTQYIWSLEHDLFKKEVYNWTFYWCNQSNWLDDLLEIYYEKV